VQAALDLQTAAYEASMATRQHSPPRRELAAAVEQDRASAASTAPTAAQVVAAHETTPRVAPALAGKATTVAPEVTAPQRLAVVVVVEHQPLALMAPVLLAAMVAREPLAA
jgi:hypothetical protein